MFSENRFLASCFLTKIQHFTKIDEEKHKNWTNFNLESNDYRIYYVNIDLRHQFGIFVTGLQTFLLVKHPSAVMSEEECLPFAGYRKPLLGKVTQVIWLPMKYMMCTYFVHNLISSNEWRELIFIPVVLPEQWSQPLIMPPASWHHCQIP